MKGVISTEDLSDFSWCFSSLVALDLYSSLYDSVWTYLFGFYRSDWICDDCDDSCPPWKKTPDEKNLQWLPLLRIQGLWGLSLPLALFTSHLFSQLMTNGWASLLTTLVSFSLAALSFILLNQPYLDVNQKIFGISMDLRSSWNHSFTARFRWPCSCLGLHFLPPASGLWVKTAKGGFVNPTARCELRVPSRQCFSDFLQYVQMEWHDRRFCKPPGIRLFSRVPDIQMDALVSHNLDSGLKVYEMDYCQ